MTCIIGYKKSDNEVIMGCDSNIGGDNYIFSLEDKKIFHKQGNILFGSSGYIKLQNLLNFNLSYAYNGKESFKIFLYTELINKIRLCFIENNFDMTDGDSILIAYKNELYLIEENYQILNLKDKFMVIGSGEILARGSLYTTEKLKLPVEESIILALKAAEKFSSSVKRPFYLYSSIDENYFKEIN